METGFAGQTHRRSAVGLKHGVLQHRPRPRRRVAISMKSRGLRTGWEEAELQEGSCRAPAPPLCFACGGAGGGFWVFFQSKKPQGARGLGLQRQSRRPLVKPMNPMKCSKSLKLCYSKASSQSQVYFKTWAAMFHGQKAQMEAPQDKPIKSSGFVFRKRIFEKYNPATNSSSEGTWPLAFGINLLSLVIFISGCSHASVPLYQPYRQASGFGGTVQKGS